MKVAIIGGGVSGLSLAHYLNERSIDFVLFEKNHHLGGNAHTRELFHNGKRKFVDLAVNDFNPGTYHNLNQLLQHTLSPTGQVNADTAFHGERDFHFKESDLPSERLKNEVERFRLESLEVLTNETFRRMSVREYFLVRGYSLHFLHEYLYPRIKGFFFYPTKGMDDLPVYFVMNFYRLQGGFRYQDVPLKTRSNFKHGSQSWLTNLSRMLPEHKILTGRTPTIIKDGAFFLVDGQRFQRLVFACHADAVNREVISEEAANTLALVKYAKLTAVAHEDANYLPLNSAEVSAYNCIVDPQDKVSSDYTITYNCNEHQNLKGPGKNTEDPKDLFFVTVNPTKSIEERFVLKDTEGRPLIKEFKRNVCDYDLLFAQEKLNGLQGKENIFFAGGYTNGIGLHENCLIQSKKIAEEIVLGVNLVRKGSAV